MKRLDKNNLLEVIKHQEVSLHQVDHSILLQDNNKVVLLEALSLHLQEAMILLLQEVAAVAAAEEEVEDSLIKIF
jgi:hypothetical protein